MAQPRQSGWRRLVRTAITLTIAAGVGASGAAVATPTATPDDPGRPMPGLGAVDATVASFGPHLLTEGRRLTIGVDVDNTSVVEGNQVEGLWAEMRLTREPLATRQDIADFYDNPATAATVRATRSPVGATDVGDSASGTVDIGERDRVSLTVSTDDLDLTAGGWGIYGVSIVLHAGEAAAVVDTMVITWVDDELPRLPLSVVSTASGSSTRIDAIVEAADHPAVTLLVDPTMMSAETAFDSAPYEREIYRLPARHPDITSLAHAEDSSLLTYATDLSSTQSAAALRDLPWLGVVAGLDVPTVELLNDAGAVAAMVEPRYGSLPMDPTQSRDSPIANARVPSTDQDFPVIRPQAHLSTLLAEFRPSHPGTPARVIAEAAMLAAEGDGVQPVVASTGASWMIGEDGTSPSLRALLNAPWVEPVTLAEVLSEAERGSVAIPDTVDTADDVPASDLADLVDRLDQIQRLALTTEDPDSLITPATHDALNAVSLHGRADTGQRAASVGQVLQRLQNTVDSVSITSGSALNLVAAAGDVPVTIRNDLPVDATVQVAMMTASPYINVTDQPTVTIPAESEVTALVPVTAVSSANVNVSVTLRNADGDPVTNVVPLEIRVRADWGNAVTGVFTVGLVLLLIAGLVRTIRRGRKDTRTGPGSQAERAEPTPADSHD
jgi:hypothetical protein